MIHPALDKLSQKGNKFSVSETTGYLQQDSVTEVEVYGHCQYSKSKNQIILLLVSEFCKYS